MSATFFARLSADADAAKRVAALLAESLDGYGAAVAAIEGERSWTVEAHFVREPDRAIVTELVRVAAGDEAAAGIEFGTLGPKDWTAASRAALVPVRVGRFVLHGSHDREAVAPHEIGIEIEAALAFGTGHHGTTRGCLRAIERTARRERPRRILDIGTGTGVLAIAAAGVFRRPVVAGDVDPVAVETASANAQANHAAAVVRVMQAAGVNAPAIRAGAPYDLVLANIVLGPLKLLAKPVARLLAPRAIVVLSGLLPDQANAALVAWRAVGLKLARRDTLEGWVTLTLSR
ncbi:MAG TPA: 50S ribosomal protein L11 methyltransferase [Xanthobacteraceae bacterium]